MSPISWLTAWGVLAACLSILAFLPYLRGMVSGRCFPLRSTWLIWAVLSAMSLLANISEGATQSLYFIGTQTGFTVLIALLSIRYGMGGYIRKGDRHILLIAAVGIALWWMTSHAVWALAIAIGISALGGVATIYKTFRNSESENKACWGLSTLSAVAGAVSVGTADPVLLAYPLYLCLLYGGILLAILGGRSSPRAGGDLAQEVPLLLHPTYRVDRVYARNHLKSAANGSVALSGCHSTLDFLHRSPHTTRERRPPRERAVGTNDQPKAHHLLT